MNRVTTQALGGMLRWATVLLLSIVSVTATYAGEGDHAEAEGLILRQDGAIIVTVWEGAVTGEIETVHEETTSEITVSFLDLNQVEFTPDVTDGFLLHADLVDPTAVAYTSTGRSR